MSEDLTSSYSCDIILYMASNLERLADMYAAEGFSEVSVHLKAGAQIARKLGAPESIFDALKTQEDSSNQTPEKEIKISRFSEEQKAALKKEGYIFFDWDPRLASVKAAIESGYDCQEWYNPYDKSIDLNGLESIHSEIAFNPEEFYRLRDAVRPEWWDPETRSEQEDSIDKLSKHLGEEIKGVKAIMGGVPDYVRIIFQHLDATGKKLFKPRRATFGGDAECYVRAASPAVTDKEFIVGYYPNDPELLIRGDESCYEETTYLAPLVVPDKGTK